ncbi:MAG: hypothetical protein ACRD32_07255 [Nitrososphaerales archaeon]
MKKKELKKQKAKSKSKSKSRRKIRTRKKSKVLSTKERKELQEMFRESLTFD